MSEEFKPIRITLSPEAFDRLDTIMKIAKFRSQSSTIEECVRTVYEIMNDISGVLGREGEPQRGFTEAEAFHAFIIIATRMARITGRGARLRIETKE